MASSHLLYVSDFSGILSKAAIERLADVDEFEVVREVQVSKECHPTSSLLNSPG
jgi:hypothetical protein